MFPAAIYLIGFFVIVAVYLIGMSLTVAAEEGAVSLSMGPMVRVLSMPDFREALANTVLFVIAGTPLELALGLWLSLMLYQSFALRGFIRGIYVIPLAVPALVTATLLFILFDYPGGHINHLLLGKYPIFPACIESPLNWRSSKFFSLGISLLGKVWRDMPISMLILLAGLNAIDPELFDAAKTMGAGPRRRLWNITLPLILPSISAVVLLRSIEMWKEFIFPFVLAGQHNLLGTLIESLYNDWGRSQEAAVVALVLVGCILISALILLYILDRCRKALARL